MLSETSLRLFESRWGRHKFETYADDPPNNPPRYFSPSCLAVLPQKHCFRNPKSAN